MAPPSFLLEHLPNSWRSIPNFPNRFCFNSIFSVSARVWSFLQQISCGGMLRIPSVHVGLKHFDIFLVQDQPLTWVPDSEQVQGPMLILGKLWIIYIYSYKYMYNIYIYIIQIHIYYWISWVHIIEACGCTCLIRRDFQQDLQMRFCSWVTSHHPASHREVWSENINKFNINSRDEVHMLHRSK
jgi:hypothetical protein